MIEKIEVSSFPAEESGYPKDALITCPVCQLEQIAHIHFYVGDPFSTYWHLCNNCAYEIGESEWNEL